jgi:hypothetical protein
VSNEGTKKCEWLRTVSNCLTPNVRLSGNGENVKISVEKSQKRHK